MLSIQFWWDNSEEYSYFLGVCVSCPCPEVELSEVEHEVIDCGLSVCVLLCFIKPILGNRYGPGVNSLQQ